MMSRVSRDMIAIVPTVLFIFAFDFIGPWYLPVFIYLALGVVAAVKNKKLFLITLAWPLYSAVLTGIWVNLKNIELSRSIATMFKLPYSGMLWVIPFVVFWMLAALAYETGRVVTHVIWKRPHARRS